MRHPTDKIIHTTAFVTPVVEHWLEREIAQRVHPMKDRSDDPSHHERTLLPRSYISPRQLSTAVVYCCWVFFSVISTLSLTQVQRAQVVTLHGEGYTKRDIAAKLHCSKTALHTV